MADDAHLSEFQTRSSKIDVMLREQNWILPKRKFGIVSGLSADLKKTMAVAESKEQYGKVINVIEEVDTKQSDFKIRDYKTVDETLKNDLESKYADYLLLDSNGDSLAIIEAKRTSKDPIATAQTQAAQYADDIKKQTGKDVFIFLSNGYEIWFWNRPYQGLRQIRGFYSRGDLEKIIFQNKNRQRLSNISINKEIVDRPKSIECVKRVLEHLDKGHRKALIVMATGTGKTRVAMSIIDVMMKAKQAQKILFLADRKALRNQAYNKGFKKFFPEESKAKIYSGNIDRNANLYVSTIQTLSECYTEISPGYFDLIISDEAHRSIYNKWKDVFTYFDAVQIGLTATPADMIDHDTFRFFECGEKQATAVYSYEDAIKDGVLCDFKVQGAQTHFQIKGVKTGDLSKDMTKEMLERGMNPDEINFEGTDFEKKFVTTGTNEALVKEFMEHCLTDETGTIPAKSIIFAMSKKHAKRIWEAFEKLYPEYKSKLARIIVSEDSRAQDSIEEFEKNKWPRVAISVDMLDTGIDVPEVCNLMFAKPVFSKIKFWQMIGRGTRANSACEHKEWLPNGKKEYFKIFDFWNNFERFSMKPEGEQTESSEAITNRIFRMRIEQLEYLMKKGDGRAEFLKKKISEDVDSLPKDSVSVREHLRVVEKALSPKLWTNVGTNPIEFLKKDIAPLMRYKQNVNIIAASFTLKAERLALAILKNNENELERLPDEICKMLDCLPRTLNQIKLKEALLDKVMSKKFWNDVCFDDAQMLIDEFAELMKFKRDEPREPIIINIDDVVEQRKIIEFGPDAEQEYVKVYKEKVDKRIKELVKEHPTIKKIFTNEKLTEKDVRALEETLNSPELYFTEDVLKQFYKGTFVNFIKETLGLYKEESPEVKIKKAFETHLVENNKLYNADQLNFIRTLQTVFAKKKHIEYSDLFDAPFINFGINAPIPMFEKDELKGLVTLCNRLEKDVFMGG
ncbi:DEAD/DEAH box helicase family protein [archaeon]|nr:DEAD/DEAH box helicase family protein [Nanoarchaeota archaeon]MBU4452113.1 DEAD/DEAH box helicase family protein [Nanoarchaeota archaeon]MCG2724619.1 DEAD/DEAH box helicase family protein [archaeon]